MVILPRMLTNERIRELEAARQELIAALESAQCSCPASGHKVGCWKPRVETMLARLKGEA